MGLFSNQFSNVVEWNEGREGVLFYKWQNQEIKKGSRLIIRPGQDAIFLYNGVVEGIFEDEGSYDIESDIIPFLTTLKSFKFGFNTPLRAEVLFINTKELLVKWGTKNAINLPAQGLPGGMPIRAFGTFNCRHVYFRPAAGVAGSEGAGGVSEGVSLCPYSKKRLNGMTDTITPPNGSLCTRNSAGTSWPWSVPPC